MDGPGGRYTPELVDELLAASPVDLLRRLGATHEAAFPGDLYERGIEFMDRILDHLLVVICASAAAREAQRRGDTISLFTAVADLLAAQIGVLPAATAAALIVKIGFDRLCGEHQ